MFGRILLTLTDPSGRRVVLDDRGWRHGADDHPERGVQQTAIVRAVEQPTFRLHGRRQGEEWFYLEGTGPSLYAIGGIGAESRRPFPGGLSHECHDWRNHFRPGRL